MWTPKPKLIILLITILLGTILGPVDAGVKQFVKDTYEKVRRIFQCDSHEADEDHRNAIEKGGTSTVGTNGVGRSEDATVNTIEGLNIEEIFNNAPTTTPYPEIDVRNAGDQQDFVLGSRILIEVPKKNCPDGFRPGHGDKCRPVV